MLICIYIYIHIYIAPTYYGPFITLRNLKLSDRDRLVSAKALDMAQGWSLRERQLLVCKEERHKARNDLGKGGKRFGVRTLFRIYVYNSVWFWCGKENDKLLRCSGKATAGAPNALKPAKTMDFCFFRKPVGGLALTSRNWDMLCLVAALVDTAGCLKWLAPTAFLLETAPFPMGALMCRRSDWEKCFGMQTE